MSLESFRIGRSPLDEYTSTRIRSVSRRNVAQSANQFKERLTPISPGILPKRDQEEDYKTKITCLKEDLSNQQSEHILLKTQIHVLKVKSNRSSLVLWSLQKEVTKERGSLKIWPLMELKPVVLSNSSSLKSEARM